MNRVQKEAWMWGYQQAYCEGYDSGYEKGFEEGYSKGFHEGNNIRTTTLGFVKAKCRCGYVFLFPILKTKLTTEFCLPDSHSRRCPRCHKLLPQNTIKRALCEYRNRSAGEPLNGSI